MTRAKTPPKHLSSGAKKWWRSVTSDFSLDEHHIKLLTAAAELWDRGQEGRSAAERDGALVPDRFGVLKEHAGCKLERDSKVAFARLLRELALDHEAPSEEYTRPPQAPTNANRLRAV